MTNIIETKELQKIYGKAAKPAVESLSFTMSEGEIFGLLGPNGAGKTTIVLMLTTLTRPTKGEGWVCGHSILTESGQVRASIGYCPQETSVDEDLTGWENMMLYAHLSGLSENDARQRVGQLFEAAALEAHKKELVRNYSGGMRRRLEVMGALIHRPRILFLDEPTLGLDPQFRRELWHRIGQTREAGSSVFITTHYLEEAEALCDRVGIINEGQIQVIGAPSGLKAEIGEVIHLSLLNPGEEATALQQLRTVSGVKEIVPAPDGFHIFAPEGEALMPTLIGTLKQAGIAVKSFTFARATLDDIFLQHTGRRMVGEAI